MHIKIVQGGNYCPLHSKADWDMNIIICWVINYNGHIILSFEIGTQYTNIRTFYCDGLFVNLFRPWKTKLFDGKHIKPHNFRVYYY